MHNTYGHVLVINACGIIGPFATRFRMGEPLAIVQAPNWELFQLETHSTDMIDWLTLCAPLV